MCGINTLFRYTSISPGDIEKLAAMNREMDYRGPDENGTWNDNKVGMAHVRLSIIGLENGRQPLFNEDKSIVLICNGEIYNYIELKELLISEGHTFSSDSDSETIIHLYEKYGTDCLHYLRGQYSFCLWDSRKKQLLAARDRIGEKTLYYSQIPGGVILSTELKAILKNFLPNPQVELEQLAAPIRYTAPTSREHTFIGQIKRVEPGQYLLIDDSGLRKYHYWKRDTTPRFTGSFAEAKEETLRLMRESVNLSMRSDVPVAVMLSGGIDSSAIAALAKEAGREVHTITAGYKGQHDCDERGVARQFAKEQGFIYHEVELDEKDFYECFEEFTQHIDEPITDSAAIAQWALYKKVKSLGFKVLLGGMGGDELFYGYPYWNSLAKSLAIQREHQNFFPWTGNKRKLGYLKFLARNWQYIFKAGYPRMIRDQAICTWMYNDYRKFADTASFTFEDQQRRLTELNMYFTFAHCEPGRELDLVYDFSFLNIMTMAYLYLSDREGMGNSIEIRSPLLDYKLVDFVTSLPVDIKFKNEEPKYFMKKVLSGIVPDYILYGVKKGFTPPTAFIEDVVKQYNYNFFDAGHKFYNSVLADRLMTILLKNG
jgi:asparagine synthase (glutamine-hydrolysing)